MKKFLCICFFLQISCSEKVEVSDSYEVYHEFYTTYFSHVAVVQMKNIEDINKGCQIEIDLYETSESFRNTMDDKYTADEYVPYNGFNSKYDNFELPLDEMKHLRSIKYLDRIRPVLCVSDDPDEYYTELQYFRWIEGMTPSLGHSGHVINRSDTAFVMSIRREESIFYLW